jgi:hypothetical protein
LNYLGSCTIIHSSNVISITPQFTTKELFLISNYSLKIYLALILFLICITLEVENFGSQPTKRCT